MSDKGVKPIAIPVEFVFPDDIRACFSTLFTIQHEPDFFTLSFFEVFPPLLMAASPEDRQKKMGDIKSVQARCVARVAVTPNKMREIQAAISENLDRYDSMVNSEDDDDTDSE